MPLPWIGNSGPWPLKPSLSSIPKDFLPPAKMNGGTLQSHDTFLFTCEEKMKNTWKRFLLIGMIGIFTCGSQFAVKYGQAIWGNQDIWWTPMQMALPLDDTKNEFAIFISGEPLQKHVDRGSLSTTDNSGKPFRVASGDIKVRINNWHKTKTSLLHGSVYPALALGSCITLFGIGLAQWIAQRRHAVRCHHHGEGSES